MGTLSGRQIKELVQSKYLVIDPFDEKLVMPASYDLRLGSPVLASPLGPSELGAAIQLNDQSPSYQIQAGQMVGVISFEKLVFPLDICSGRFGIRSEFARKGINPFGGVQLDPGWRGRVVMNLQNVGPEPVLFTLGQPFFTVEFQRLEEPAEEYAGRYQDQYDFPPDQYDFILSAKTSSLAEIPTLRGQVAKLNILIEELMEELKERLPDPDAGLRLKPDVEVALRRSLAAPRKDLLSPDEAWERLRG